MADTLSDRIWNRYVRPGVTQHRAPLDTIYRRIQNTTITSDNFTSTIYRHWNPADYPTQPNPLPVVSARPVSTESDQPSPHTEAAPENPAPRPVVHPQSIQRSPDSPVLVPKTESAPPESERPATNQATADIPLPVVRPHPVSIQRSPDRTPSAPARPAAEAPLVKAPSDTPRPDVIRPPSPVIKSDPAPPQEVIKVYRETDLNLPLRPTVQRTPEPTVTPAPSTGAALPVPATSSNPAPSVPPPGTPSAPPAPRPVVRPHAPTIQRAPDAVPISNRPSAPAEGQLIVVSPTPTVVVQRQTVFEAAPSFYPNRRPVVTASPTPLVSRSATVPTHNEEVKAPPGVLPIMRSAEAPVQPAQNHPAPPPPSPNIPPPIQRAETSPASPAATPDVDELVEKVLHKFMREMAVQNERRGKW